MDLPSRFRIDRMAVLEFYDARPKNSSKHASAVNAVMGEDLGAGLLKHYLTNVKNADVKILEGTCTPGTQAGNRLDRWVSVKWPDNPKPTLFQVEIKNWSSHSKGGKSLPVGAAPEQVARHKMERWAKEWDDAEGQLLKKETRKVLLPMKTAQSGDIEPILCMWDAMHPTGHEEPWFSIDLPAGSHFGQLWVFSMSSYLRSLEAPSIEVEMPETRQRLQWLNTFLAEA